MGGAKAQYMASSPSRQTDFTADLKKITVPVMVMHGDDDPIVPYAVPGHCRQSVENADAERPTKAFPHGMPTTEGPPSTRPARLHQG